MKYCKVDSADARLLVRSMGLLLNQAAVYGPVHNVTKTATSRVYEEINENLERYGVLEFTVKSNLICVNGLSGDLDSSVSSNLVRRFAQLDINGLMFVNPLSAREFERSIKVLSLPIAMITEASGVQPLFLSEDIKSVRVVNVDYKRVDAGEETLDSETGMVGIGAAGSLELDIPDSGVFDISDDLVNFAPELSAYEVEKVDNRQEMQRREAERKKRKAQSAKLADLLRKTAETLESNSVENPKVELGRVVGALEIVRSTLLDLSRGSQRAITTFAREVDEDKLTVAGLEEDARRRGLNLKLTRENLIERYAELNQEIIQPLTVSTGVIEMLRKNQAGEVSESQGELLKMAHESIDRVNQLVNYINAVTGLPKSYNPDISIIEDSYGSTESP